MSRRNEVAERKRAYVAQNAERVLADTSYNRLRSPGSLLALVIADVATTIAIPVCWLVWGPLAGVASIFPCVGAFLLLRVAVRSQADLPDEVLVPHRVLGRAIGDSIWSWPAEKFLSNSTTTWSHGSMSLRRSSERTGPSCFAGAPTQ